ncbi:hypothetical protein ACFL0W_03090 [Nanoarchaeota archaeon]
MKKTNIMKIFSLIFAVLILASSAMAVTMNSYPEVFKDESGKIDVEVVVGDKGPAEDVVSAVDIGAFLNFKHGIENSAKLASEILPDLDKNLIVIGTKGTNQIAEKLVENYGITIHSDQAVIKIVNKDSYTHLIVVGATKEYTRLASRVLADPDNFEDYFSCNELYVTGNNFQDIKVSCEPFEVVEVPIVGEPPVFIELFTGSEAIVSANDLKHEITLVDTSYLGNTCGLDVDGDVVWLRAGESKTVNGVNVKVYDAEIIKSYPQDQDQCKISIAGDTAFWLTQENVFTKNVNGVDHEITVVDTSDSGYTCGLDVDGDVVWLETTDEEKIINDVSVKIKEASLDRCLITARGTLISLTHLDEPVVVPVDEELDLSEYPNFFLQDGKFAGLIVVGEKAPAEDVVTAVDIGASIQFYIQNRYSSTSTVGSSNVNIGSARLSSEVSNIKKVHAIVVGNPITNPKVKELYPDFYEDVQPGEAVIKLFHNNGKTQLVVGGYGVQSTRKAARILSTWDSYDLDGYVHFIETGVEDEALPAGSIVETPQPITTIEENVTVTTLQTICDSGCSRNNSCLPFGTRLINEGDADTPKYCNMNKEFQLQKSEGQSCQNNYECVSNQCSNGECIDLEKQIKENREEIEQQSNTLKKILNWLKNLF